MAAERTHPAHRADERTTLTEFLDFYRAAIVEQVADLTDAEACANVPPATAMTAGGIVKHLAYMEDQWFQLILHDRPLPEPWASAPLDTDRDWPFHSSTSDAARALIGLYEAACERSRVAIGEVEDLAAQGKRASRRGPVSLRWILVHMVEETARHAGHVDLLRDAIDTARRQPT